MYIEPCAKLTMRVTPKISDRPTATRNSDEAPARPFSSWTARPAITALVLPHGPGISACLPRHPGADWKVASRGTRSVRASQLGYLGVRWKHGRAVDIAERLHHAAALVHRGCADESAHRRLVIRLAIGDRAERRVVLQPFERSDHLFGVGAAGLLDRRGDRKHGRITDH